MNTILRRSAASPPAARAAASPQLRKVPVTDAELIVGSAVLEVGTHSVGAGLCPRG